MPTIVVHGGAGARPGDGAEAVAARQGCARAAAVGHAILLARGRALDAVQAAVRELEDDERFNAGRGSCLTRAGTVEMDAGLMSGDGLRVGAVAALTGVRNPIELARRLLDDGGLPAGEAATRALATLDRVAGRAGLILVDRGGGFAAVHNTVSMAWAALS